MFSQDELDNIFDTYSKGSIKRPIGLKATLNLLKLYIKMKQTLLTSIQTLNFIQIIANRTNESSAFGLK